MNVQRSPPKATSSLTNLPSAVNESLRDNQVTQRKRKQPEQSCNCENILQDFRKDIAEMLQKFTTTQEATMNFVRDNITEIKTQLDDIKASTESLKNEQICMKAQISDLTHKATTADSKIHTIESKIAELKNGTGANDSGSQFDENVMHELQDRTSREKNVILVGLPECKESTDDQGQSYDTNEVISILNQSIPDCPKPLKIFRLGKYNRGKDRHVKVCFETSHTAKLLLRNKNKIQSNIRIYSDQTPAQQNYMKDLRNLLAQRIAKGENGISIKYVKGIPKIVTSSDTKN